MRFSIPIGPVRAVQRTCNRRLLYTVQGLDPGGSEAVASGSGPAAGGAAAEPCVEEGESPMDMIRSPALEPSGAGLPGRGWPLRLADRTDRAAGCSDRAHPAATTGVPGSAVIRVVPPLQARQRLDGGRRPRLQGERGARTAVCVGYNPGLSDTTRPDEQSAGRFFDARTSAARSSAGNRASRYVDNQTFRGARRKLDALTRLHPGCNAPDGDA